VQLVTEDFACDHGHPRSSLIELILPFAQEARSIVNLDGLQPWQVALDNRVAQLLKPSLESDKVDINTTGVGQDDDNSVQLPVTAS